MEHREKVELKIQAGLVTSPVAAKPQAPSKPAPRPPPEVSSGGGGSGGGTLDVSLDEPSKPVRKKPTLSSQRRAPKKDEGEEGGDASGKVVEDEPVKKKPVPKQVNIRAYLHR